MADTTATYIACCTVCGGLMGCSVADVTSVSMACAVRYRARWLKKGYRVSTVTVQAVRDWPEPLGHQEGCVRGRRRRQRVDIRDRRRLSL